MEAIYKQLPTLLQDDYNPEILQSIANMINLHIINKQLIDTNVNKHARIINKPDIRTRFPNHEVAPNVSIRAYDIEYPEDCHTHRGYWCYCTTNGRFYTSINNISVYGYITNILPENAHLHKFTEYIPRNKSSGVKDNFYCPPELYGGNDVRNLTERLRYAPYNTNKKNPYVYRIGDKNNICEDLTTCTQKDMRLVRDISAHWLMLGFLTGVEQSTRK